MNKDTVYSTDVVKSAGLALLKPADFLYSGPKDTFVTWGFSGINMHQSSDMVQISNFYFLSDTLCNQYPNDFRIETFSHWAVGSLSELMCRILISKKEGVTVDNITDAFKASTIVHKKLENYPLADEDHYFNLISTMKANGLYVEE